MYEAVVVVISQSKFSGHISHDGINSEKSLYSFAPLWTQLCFIYKQRYVLRSTGKNELIWAYSCN